MKHFNTPFLALASLLAFLWLAQESKAEHGYTRAQIDGLNALSERVTLSVKRASMTKQQQREALVILWGN